MEEQKNERTLEQVFEFVQDEITESYEVVRTIGFDLKAKSGTKQFRLEAIERPGKELWSVLVWEIKDGTLHSYPIRQPTLDRVHPDLALQAMVEFIRQHYADFAAIS
jgi:hypothetical protein